MITLVIFWYSRIALCDHACDHTCDFVITLVITLVIMLVIMLVITHGQRLNRKGLSDKRLAVGFCLGSGLFGSYNSD